MSCLNCHGKAFFIEKNTNRYFCSKPCQIGLIADIDDDDIIGIKCNDGELFHIHKTDIGILKPNKDYYILKNTDGPTFKLFLKTLKNTDYSKLDDDSFVKLFVLYIDLNLNFGILDSISYLATRYVNSSKLVKVPDNYLEKSCYFTQDSNIIEQIDFENQLEKKELLKTNDKLKVAIYFDRFDIINYFHELYDNVIFDNLSEKDYDFLLENNRKNMIYELIGFSISTKFFKRIIDGNYIDLARHLVIEKDIFIDAADEIIEMFDYAIETEKYEIANILNNLYMPKNESIGLKVSLNDENIIGIICSDGRKFHLTRKMANKMKTIELLLENTNSNEYIVLKDIEGDTFHFIYRLLTSKSFFNIKTTEEYVKLANAYLYLNYRKLGYNLFKGTFSNVSNKLPKQFLSMVIYMNRNRVTKDVFDKMSKLFEKDLILNSKIQKIYEAKNYSDLISIALEYNDIDVALYMLEEKKLESLLFKQAFYDAIKYDRIELVLKFIKKKYIGQDTIYYAAIKTENVELFKLLTSSIKDKRSIYQEAFNNAAISGNSEILQICTIEEKNLDLSVFKDAKPEMRLLILNVAKNDQISNFLKFSVEKNDIVVVEIILEKYKVDTNILKECTKIAFKENFTDITKKLLDVLKNTLMEPENKKRK